MGISDSVIKHGIPCLIYSKASCGTDFISTIFTTPGIYTMVFRANQVAHTIGIIIFFMLVISVFPGLPIDQYKQSFVHILDVCFNIISKH